MAGPDIDHNIGPVFPTALSSNATTQYAGMKVLRLWDVEKGTITDIESGKSEKLNLPKSNVLKFEMENNCWFAVRPSGTEPKIKFYFGVNEPDMASSKAKIELCEKELEKLIK